MIKLNIMHFADDKNIDLYLKRLQNGEQCFEEFFHEFSGKVRFIAYMYLLDKSYTDDVVMNAFCRVLNYIGKYREDANGMAWVCKIAQNEAYQINNRERRQKYFWLEEVGENVASEPDYFTGSTELLADLERAINALEERERQIVTMRLMDGLQYPEIASKLNMYVGTVYKFYQRAIKKIAKDIL